MADSSNSSFIPKRGPAARSNKSSTRKVYVLSLVSYILIFSALLAAGAVYLYGEYVNRLLDAEVESFSQEITGFNEADMRTVAEFDQRLVNTQDRVNVATAISSVFTALEAATIGTVQMQSFALSRDGDSKVVIDAEILTDSFDSALFQRKVLKGSQVIETVLVSDVVLGAAVVEDGDETSPATVVAEEDAVTFALSIEVPLSAVPYIAPPTVATTSQAFRGSVQVPPAVTNTASTAPVTNGSNGNQTNI